MRNLFITRKYKNVRDFDEDFFCEKNNHSGHDSHRGEDEFLGKYLSDKKINVFFALMLFFLLILLGRSFQLQVASGEYYSSLSERNRTKETALVATRGLIYDKNYQPLVKNKPIFDAAILPRDLSVNNEKRKEQISNIAGLIEQDENSIYEVLSKHPFNFKYLLVIKENIEYEDAIKYLIDGHEMPGLYIETRNQREYFNSNEFSHLMGYLGRITEDELKRKEPGNYLLNDYIGKTGLELMYEEVLRGQYGKKKVEVDVYGQIKKVLNQQEPQSGKNLVLSIDNDVQKNVREIAIRYLEKNNKKKASIVLLNPQNGEIIALISLPDFDNNLFAGGISADDYKSLIENEDHPLFNRAIKGEYPSGSTIKPVVAAAALQEGIVTDKTSFLSTGGLMLYNRWFFPDWASGGHGATNIYRAIAWSVNTYFYIIGGGYEDYKGLGEAGLKKYYNLFGLGERTGIDLLGESSGLVPDSAWKIKNKNEQWYIGDTYHIAIGQGDLLVTPLQVANYTAVFANQGVLYQPHLVKEIFSNNGDREPVEPKIIRQNFIDNKNLEILKKAMRQTVTAGSAQYLNNLDVAVAGKTGTAQWSKLKDNHAWFAGFAPYDNPSLVITVLVDEGGEGSQVSVPLAYEILKWYFSEYNENL